MKSHATPATPRHASPPKGTQDTQGYTRHPRLHKTVTPKAIQDIQGHTRHPRLTDGARHTAPPAAPARAHKTRHHKRRHHKARPRPLHTLDCTPHTPLCLHPPPPDAHCHTSPLLHTTRLTGHTHSHADMRAHTRTHLHTRRCTGRPSLRRCPRKTDLHRHGQCFGSLRGWGGVGGGKGGGVPNDRDGMAQYGLQAVDGLTGSGRPGMGPGADWEGPVVDRLYPRARLCPSQTGSSLLCPPARQRERAVAACHLFVHLARLPIARLPFPPCKGVHCQADLARAGSPLLKPCLTRGG